MSTRIGGRDARRALLLLLVALASPRIAASEGVADSGANRFLPSLAGVVGLDVQGVEASLNSSTRGAFEDDDRIVFPSPGAELELMAPALRLLPGHPRLFVQGGGAAALDGRRNVVQEGTPGVPVIPIVDANNDGIPDPGREAPASGATGVGSAVRSKVKGLVWRAGAGVAFTTSLGERTLWIKPSVVYQRQETDIITIVSAVESIDDDLLCPCRSTVVKRTDSDRSDHLGGGLELEMDAARAGDFLVTLSLSGRVYNLLSDRTVTSSIAGAFSDGKPVMVQSRFERDPWSYAGSIGIRVRWLPLTESDLPE